MKKIVIMLLLLASNLLLSSCMRGGENGIFVSGDRKTDIHFEQILENLKNKDKTAFKEMFSKQALEEADDFDGNMEYLFEFFQGSIKSWERSNGSITSSTYEYGIYSSANKFWYIVTTDKEEYIFFVVDYFKDTINPDNEGLYGLRVIKTKDKKTQFTFEETPGIHNPGR